ncbi:MAG TPA: hypothetical protein VEG64_13990 [Candidatus Sulfotelmatobacter sp.]|nr:hypothetical protein [Candidatus Sulfotelmatobacter sp.]
MTRNTTLRIAVSSAPIFVASLSSYATSPADNDQTAAQIVAQGNKNGVVACARCHGFDGAADASGASK